MRASGAATPTAGEAGGETGYPQKPVFASADAMQLSLRARPNMAAVKSPLGTQEDTMEDIASLTGTKFVAEKY